MDDTVEYAGSRLRRNDLKCLYAAKDDMRGHASIERHKPTAMLDGRTRR